MRRALTALGILTVLLLTACGGGGSSGPDAATLVRQTFSTSHPVHSGRLKVGVVVVVHGVASLNQPIRLDFAGPFDRGAAGSGAPRFAFTLSGSLAGQSFSAGATSTGSQGFLSLGSDAYQLPASEYASLRKSFGQLQGLTQPKAAGANGTVDWLSDPRVVGDADVSGVATTHVTGAVDVAKLLSEVEARQSSSSRLGAAQQSQIAQALRNPRFDFYTGQADHVLRRVRLSFSIDVPADRRAALNGLSSADVSLDYAVADLNQPQTIPAPSNPKPISQLAPRLQQLGQLVASLSGSAAGGSGQSGSAPGGGTSGGGASPGVSKQAQQYTQCINAAGNDVAKIQKCARFLR